MHPKRTKVAFNPRYLISQEVLMSQYNATPVNLKAITKILPNIKKTTHSLSHMTILVSILSLPSWQQLGLKTFLFRAAYPAFC